MLEVGARPQNRFAVGEPIYVFAHLCNTSGSRFAAGMVTQFFADRPEIGATRRPGRSRVCGRTRCFSVERIRLHLRVNPWWNARAPLSRHCPLVFTQRARVLYRPCLRRCNRKEWWRTSATPTNRATMRSSTGTIVIGNVRRACRSAHRQQEASTAC